MGTRRPCNKFAWVPKNVSTEKSTANSWSQKKNFGPKINSASKIPRWENGAARTSGWNIFMGKIMESTALMKNFSREKKFLDENTAEKIYRKSGSLGSRLVSSYS